MKTLLAGLLLSLLMSFGQSLAAHVYFDDGRVCKSCKVEADRGFITSVKDKKGEEWVLEGKKFQAYIVPHPYLAAYARASAMGLQQYGQNLQQQQYLNQVNRPINTYCNQYGTMTNCSSY